MKKITIILATILSINSIPLQAAEEENAALQLLIREISLSSQSGFPRNPLIKIVMNQKDSILLNSSTNREFTLQPTRFCRDITIDVGTLPLHHAIKTSNPCVVQLLLANGADPCDQNSAGADALEIVSQTRISYTSNPFYSAEAPVFEALDKIETNIKEKIAEKQVLRTGLTTILREGLPSVPDQLIQLIAEFTY